jgi:hypothetical protein
MDLFRQYLEALPGQTPAEPPPIALLTDEMTSEAIEPAVEVDIRAFGSRMEAARYLDGRFEAASATEATRDPGVWAWLTLFYFDELCPSEGHGRRQPKQLVRLLPDKTAFRYYRHLLAGPCAIYRNFRDNPAEAAIVLRQPLDKPGDYVEQLASRQEIITNRGIIAAANALYFDAKNNRFKRGGQTREKPGTLRRFIEVLDQLSLNYDLYAFHELGPQQLLDLLPREFDKWRPRDDE